MRLAKAAMGILGLVVWVGCATPVHQSLEQIKPGMDKSQLLDLAGNPKRTHRADGHDVWTYVYFVGDKEFQRVVQLEDNRVTEISAPVATDVANDKATSEAIMKDYEKLVQEAKSKPPVTQEAPAPKKSKAKKK